MKTLVSVNRMLWIARYRAPSIFACPAHSAPLMLKKVLLFLLPLLLAAAVLVAGWYWLNHYTRHGDTRHVPDLRGSGLEEAVELLAKRDLKALVIDSIYNPELPRGSVVEQDPEAGKDVKPDRKIYLVVNASQPKMIDMPRLIDLSKRQAISIMEVVGLKVEELRYEPDPCTDCVLDQLYRGEHIEPETRIRRGEPITLVLGSGEDGTYVPVPDLRGSTLAELGELLNMASMTMGQVKACEGCNTAEDSTFARVQRQWPNPNERTMIGNPIDVWLSTDTTATPIIPDPNETETDPNDSGDPFDR